MSEPKSAIPVAIPPVKARLVKSDGVIRVTFPAWSRRRSTTARRTNPSSPASTAAYVQSGQPASWPWMSG